MSGSSASVPQHMIAQAPAMKTGAIDYAALLQAGPEQLDFYDSRDHLYGLAGPDLVHKIRIRAGALTARGMRRGVRVVMVATNDEEYLTTLLAVLLLGAIPCAVAPPSTPSRPQSAGVKHLQAAIDTVDPAMVVVKASVAAAVSHHKIVCYDDLLAVDPIAWPDGPRAESDDLHHIQLTSGSTSAPRAVLLTHGNVTHNVSAIAYGTGLLRGRDRVFTWLPLYHDMGFIQVLTALAYGLRIAVMTPMGFLRDPLSWARHMTHHGSTHTAGPSFAYRAASDAVARVEDLSGIDLTALRYAYIGAEPIPYTTVHGFTESFAPLGLRQDALVPCYGMAETVLATTVALSPAGQGPMTFGRVHTRKSTDELDGVNRPIVSCGTVLDGLQIHIIGSDGQPVPEGIVGDIQVSGPSVMLGYLTAQGDVSRPANGWHDTGDRGMLADGELFVVGRRKEMLIVRGRNFPPYDLEEVIDGVPGVGDGLSVVFSLFDDRRGRESVVAVVGTRFPEQEHGSLRTEVATTVRTAFGFSLDDIVLVPSRTIPRTTSGKRQRVEIRERYRHGRLTDMGVAVQRDSVR